jgi:hypothetical protein
MLYFLQSSVNSSDSTRDNKLEQCPVFPSIPGKDGCVGKELEGQIEKEKKKKHNRKKNNESTNVAEALQPGKIMNPGGSEGSNVKGQTDYGGQKQDVRPKSGNRRGQPNRDQRGQGQMPQNPTSQGQGQSPLGQYRQNSGNQGQYQQGRNTPGGRGGNSTPRGKLPCKMYIFIFIFGTSAIIIQCHETYCPTCFQDWSGNGNIYTAVDHHCLNFFFIMMYVYHI